MKSFFDRIKRKKGSLYSLITGYYVAFGVAVLLLLFGIVTYTNYRMEGAVFTPDARKLLEQRDDLIAENYDRLKIVYYLGPGSYIEVIDDKSKLIYKSSGANKSKDFDAYDISAIEYIPSIDGDNYYYIDSYKTESGEKGYIIHKYVYSEGEDNTQVYDVDSDYAGLAGIAILDEDKNVVYSSISDINGQVTEQEFKYMYGGDEENTYLQKYAYTTLSGEQRYLIVHIAYDTESLLTKYRFIYITSVIAFLIPFAMLIILFVLRTSVAVRKPVEMLRDAMKKLSGGRRDNTIVYSGPREFVEIIDTFNEMSEDLSRSEDERKRLENERQRMLADISHDLKTPITVIQGYSRAVADGIVAKEEQNKYLQTIADKADNLSELINTFYEYSKLEHPEFKTNLKEADICEYYREYLASKYDELELAGFILETDIPEDKIMFSFDETQLKRVFENIISNSVKSNPQGTEIFAGLKKSENGVVFYLGDSGIGIPATIRNNVFKPFVVGDDARTSGKGTGLGLSIAKLIVEAHGGNIRLMDEKETEYSTMFEIILYR